MNKVKEKRIKRLRKNKIWPSLLFLLLFLIVFGAFIVLLMRFFIEYTISSKLDTAYTNSVYISEIIEGTYRQKGWDHVFDSINTKTQAFVIDGNSHVMVQTDTEIPNFDSLDIVDMNRGYRLYFDRDSSEEMIAFDVEKVEISYEEMFRNSIKNAFKETGSPAEMKELTNQPLLSGDLGEWMNSNLLDISLWIEIPIGESEFKLIVNNQIAIMNRDVISIFLLGVITIVLMTIPMLFFLVNLISSILNQRRMVKLLYLDTLTGGDNWFCFCEKGTRILKKRNARKSFWLLSVRMNKYQNYCICYGSKAGEELLEGINNCLKPLLHKDEIFGRYANADFVLLIKEDDGSKLEERISDILSKLQKVPSNQHLSFHVGIFGIAHDKTQKYFDMEGMYHNASAARGAINSAEDTAVAFFTRNMLDEQLWERHVEERMDIAMQNKEFKVYLQPKYSPANEELGGAEALVRWINEVDGLIPPNRFIPIFEKNGFILQLDDYMISEVARLQADWIAQGKKVVPVSVNVSRAHFSKADLAEHICRLVDKYNTPHNVIELELTESAFFDDKKVILSTVKKLQEYGFVVSMDDFGSGYSSLNSLKDLPLDVIKLDAEFFRGEIEDERGEIVIKQAISLARQLNMNIVAEGIESKEQVDFLKGQGCDLIQGFYFAKPMPVEEFEKLT